MSKKPRPSINDQLARIAVVAPAVSAPASAPSQISRDDVTTFRRDDVGPSTSSFSDPTGPDGYKRRVRFEKPHASVYAHPRVFKALREIAAVQDCKPHDLYLEGLRLVLRQHGRDFDALNRGD